MITKVSGVTFPNPDGSSRRQIIANMSECDSICIEREPTNEYDRNAVKVSVIQNGQKKQIGYIDKNIAAEISPRIRRGESFEVSITSCGIYMDRPYCEIDIKGI